MSKISLTPNASGTGTLTIAAPNTSTDRTLTLPDETGTVMSSVSSVAASQLPAGSVLQVVTSSLTVGIQTNSTTFVDTGHSASITPSSSSNKILIMLNGGSWYNNNNANGISYCTFYRDSTNLEPTSGGGFEQNYCNAWFAYPHSASYLDSPSTTSSVTYKVYMRTGSTGTSFKYTQHNGSVSPAIPVTLTLMEIAA